MKVEEIDYNEVLELRHIAMYLDKDIHFVKLENDELGIHLGIKKKEILVSVVSIFLEEGTLQFRKLATRKEYEGMGYASFLIKWILDYAKEMKLKKIWANSRKNIFPFYQKLGFKKTEHTFIRNGYDYVIIEYII